MAAITYKCDRCGKDFQSGRVRKGPKYCGTCAGIIRKEGHGTVQTGKEESPVTPAAQAEVQAEATATVESGTEVAPEAPSEVKDPAPTPEKPAGVSSLADLAKEVAAKHSEDKSGAPGQSVETVEG